jgi:tetratricopeptide (TPR) repeat protein
MTAERYDAFVSYGHGDADWVRTLAENLERLELHVFLDDWELVPGDLLAIKLQEGLAAANAVVFVVSAQSVGRGWVNEEFAAAIAKAAAGQRRLIPVIYGDVVMPEFVAGRFYVDFRDIDSPAAYEAKVRELAAAIRGQPRGARPRPGGGIVPPSGAYRAEGPRSARLTITEDVVTFSTEAGEATHRPTGLDARAIALLNQAAVSRTRPGAGPLRAAAAGTAAAAGMHASLVQAGTALGRCFLNGAAGQALAGEIAAATEGGAAVRLAVDVPDARLAGLPWEALVLPGQTAPLALRDRVDMYRAVALEHPPPAIQVRGPLRILAVIASPDTGGGELLDYEAELSAIVSAVNPARRAEGAFVEVLNWGSLAAIKAALLERRYHILHISCHAQPGELVLEDAAGKADPVTAERFAAEALPADRGVPLVVLAGCSTALAPRREAAALDTGNAEPDGQSGPADSEVGTADGSAGAADGEAGAADGEAGVTGGEVAAMETAEALEGLARELLSRGVPAVVAMTAPVTDRYATTFTAAAYQQLATREEPVPLAAVSDARRVVEAARRALPEGDPWGAIAEWATPVLMQAGPAMALFRRADGEEDLPARPEPVPDPAMVVRRVGEFVGRRAELRDLLGALRGSGAGVVVHGIGGVGKSTLAAQLVEQLGPDGGLVVAVSGATSLTVDLILEALRVRLLALAVAAGLGDRDPLRQIAAALMDPAMSWRDRLELIRQIVLPRLPVLLLLDNAEDLLTGDGSGRQFADEDLAALLAAWAQAAPRAKLVVTSRYPFTLPGGAQRRLRWHHLGPLSLAETRKLIWRLPALDALPPGDQERAYAMVGGHPRTLEYLDALLRGGQAAFPDVVDRLEAAIAGRGVDDPQQWMAGIEGDLDRALAETVTLAADDVLLDDLLASLEGVAPAAELLRRLAVYRQPVDEIGTAWQLSPLTTAPQSSPELLDRLRPVWEALDQARQAGTATSAEDLGLDHAVLAQYRADTDELVRPPVSITEDARRALGLLAGLGLVAPTAAPDTGREGGAPGFFVHRWTAAALEARTSPDELIGAHRKAAAYWRWRVAVWPQTRAADVEQLLEARYHHHAAGDVDGALDANESACDQLGTWGAWATERRLWVEALSWVPPRSRYSAGIRHQLGILAENRGDYGAAEQYYQDSLAIKEELADRVGIGRTYHQLGNVAFRRGDYDAAEQRYKASLAVKEAFSDRAGIAITYHQLGMLAQDRGAYDTAERYYQDSLAIKKETGNQVGVAMTSAQLGSLAFRREDYDTAEDRYRAGLAIFAETGDRANIAIVYHQLGLIAEHRGDLGTAEQHYQRSLVIEEELGNRVGTAMSYGQLGNLAMHREDYDTAEERYRAALAIFEEIGDRIEAARTLSRLGVLRMGRGRPAEAVSYQVRALAIRASVGSPDAAIDVRMLSRQRAALGGQEFQRTLSTLTDDEGVATIMDLTEQTD